LLAVGGVEVSAARAATIYVRVTGDDTNDGRSPAHALRSITHAAAQVTPGDRVVVGPGIYAEGNIAPPPAAFARVTFIADRRGVEVGDPPGSVVVDAAGFDTGFRLEHKPAVRIDGFTIFGAAIGIYVKSQSDQVVISNTIVCNNSSTGIVVQDAAGALIFNNLVYNNAGSGILVFGTVNGSPGTAVINNTVYGNGNRGIFFSGTTIASQDSVVLNNIVQGNVVAGIQVNASSRDGYLSAGNLAADPYASGTPTDVTDVRGDPQFVDPAGPDHVLGGRGFADDDFHLQQIAAGQASTSPAVDIGSDRARRLRLSRASTRSDGRPDSGFVDAGYHYGNFSRLPVHPRVVVRHAPLYVSAANGSDLNDGSTPHIPLQTVARAFELAQPGSRIVLLDGTFHEGELILNRSGKPGRDLIIEGRHSAHINAATFARGMLLSDRHDVTLVGVEVFGAEDSGIEIRDGSTNITLRRCRFHDNAARGLYVNGATGIVADTDLFDHNDARGVQVNGGAMTIFNGSFVANLDQGLWLMNGSTVDVSASTFLDNGKSGVLAEQSQATLTDTTITGSQDGAARFTMGSVGTLTRVVASQNTDVGVQSVSSTVTVSAGAVEGNTRVGIEGIVDAAFGGSTSVDITGTRVCHNEGPGVHAQDTALTMSDVTLCTNEREGLRQSGGSVQAIGTTVMQNQQEGIAIDAADEVVLDGLHVGMNGQNGVEVTDAQALMIKNCVVYSNSANGILVLDTAVPQLWNNLIYANQSAGALISGTTAGSPNAQVLNNTIYGNADRGLVIGGSNDQPASPGATVERNIFQSNGIACTPQCAGLQINELSLPGYAGDYNLNFDPYGALTVPGRHDIFEDPQLVAPNGADHLLGGTGAGDDDFHLSQRAAGQPATSPAVDAGGDTASAAGLSGTTTRTDSVADGGPVDLGYHYQE
jgi:parallel beta-helix repeat protein